MKKFKQFAEEFTFKVDVEGLPDMFMKGNSPGEVKTHLRKLVKQPSMVKSVDRATKYDVKKRRKAQMQMAENRRDRLRARMAMIGKDMEKPNKELKKTAGIKDDPKQRLGSDGKPYKSRYESDVATRINFGNKNKTQQTATQRYKSAGGGLAGVKAYFMGAPKKGAQPS